MSSDTMYHKSKLQTASWIDKHNSKVIMRINKWCWTTSNNGKKCKYRILMFTNDVHNVIHLPKVCYCSCHPIYLPSNIPKVQTAYIGPPLN